MPLPEAEAEEFDRVSGTYDALIEEHGDDPAPEIAAQLEALSTRIDELSQCSAV